MVDEKSTTSDSWCTPQPVVDALYEFGGQPYLDPCSNPDSIVNAEVEWYGPLHGGTNGLVMPWIIPAGRYGFDNPPYTGKHEWMRKTLHEARLGNELIALLPSDTDTAWFHEFGVPSDEKCFWRGRLKFIGDRSDTARHPSCLFYYGQRGQLFRDVFSKRGWCP